MAVFITFGNQKGGAGKSTATVLAAGALSQPPFSYRLAIVDIDRQQSIAARRAYDLQDFDGLLPYEVLSYNLATFEANLEELDKRYQIVFIDVAGKLDKEAGHESEAARALAYTDLLLVPVPPGNFTLQSTVEYLEAALAIREAKRSHGQALEVRAFRNLYRDHRLTGRALGKELEELRSLAGIELLKEPLRRYALYEDTNTLETIYRPDSTEAAHRNFARWLNEIHTIIENL